MSGYFPDLKLNFEQKRDDVKKKDCVKAFAERLFSLGVPAEAPAGRNGTSNEHDNNLAEKNACPDKQEHVTEIKNVNVVQNLGQNPFNHFTTDLPHMANPAQKPFTPGALSEPPHDTRSDQPNASPKKTPDKDLNNPGQRISEVEFSFKKEKQGNDLKQFQRAEGQADAGGEGSGDSRHYSVNPGDMSKLYQKAQNGKSKLFTTPNLQSHGFSARNQTNGLGSLFRDVGHFEEPMGKCERNSRQKR